VLSRRNVVFGAAGLALFGAAGLNVARESGPTDGEGTESAGEERNVEQFSAVDVDVHGVDGTTDGGIDLAGTPVLGSDDAAVDLCYWSDYQCPFCERFEQDTFPKLVRNELDAGEVRLSLLQYPNIGSASRRLGVVARGVWEVTRSDAASAFLRWHAAVFDAQEKPNSGWATEDRIYDITAAVSGVDATAVREYVRDNRTALERAVQDEKRQGAAVGVDATPGFLVYDRESGEAHQMTGAQPYPRFQSVIDEVTGT
jgi:protein-disulfide isomerase